MPDSSFEKSRGRLFVAPGEDAPLTVQIVETGRVPRLPPVQRLQRGHRSILPAGLAAKTAPAKIRLRNATARHVAEPLPDVCLSGAGILPGVSRRSLQTPCHFSSGSAETQSELPTDHTEKHGNGRRFAKSLVAKSFSDRATAEIRRKKAQNAQDGNPTGD